MNIQRDTEYRYGELVQAPQYANAVNSLDALLNALGVDSLDDLILCSDGTSVQISLKNPSEEDEMKTLYLLNEDGVTLNAIEYNGDTGTSTFQYDNASTAYTGYMAITDDVLKEMDNKIQIEVA